MEIKTKCCTKCKKEKTVDNFFKEKLGKDGLRSYCKKCRQKQLENWRKRVKKNPKLYLLEKEKRRLNYIFQKFGLTKEHYDLLLEKQNNCCAICKTHQMNLKKTLAVDHCHISGNVRGLLCTNCNTALGLLKENIDVMHNIIDYIRFYTNKV